MKRVQLTGFAMLTVLAFASQALSQVSAEQLGLTIAVDKVTFSEKQKAKVRLRVENKTGQAIKDESTSISFYLSAYETDLGKCTNTDCFVAHAALSKKLRGGQAAEFELDLAGLFWKPLITSVIGPPRQNTFKDIPPGEYYLFVRIISRLDKSVSRTAGASSNVILIKVDGKR